MRFQVCLSVLLFGCTIVRTADPPPVSVPASRVMGNASPPSVDTSPDLGAPIAASWRVLDAPIHPQGGRLVLLARLEARTEIDTPVTVSLRIPSGLTLTQGVVNYTLQSLHAGEAHDARFEFQQSLTPPEDLILVFDARGVAAGFHGEIPYRFGRAEPFPPEPARGAPTGMNGSNFGRPIRMTN